MSTTQEPISRISENAQPEPEPKDKDTGTSSREYVILDSWHEATRVTATTQEGALESLGETVLRDGKARVAVPARYWRPGKPKVETKTTITIDFDD